MRVLLDENLPHAIRRLLTGHEAETASHAGFAGLRNGELIKAAAAAGFHVLLTMDSGMVHQQNPRMLPLGVVVLMNGHNRMDWLEPRVPAILGALERSVRGTITELSL